MTPTATLGDLVERYLADPTPAALDGLRRVVRAAPTFDPGLSVHEVVGPLLARGAYAEAVAAVQSRMPGALLSPSAHAALATALDRTGRPAEAARERRLAEAATAGLLATGDGTRARPWSVLRVGDEYDVLRAIRRRSREQSVLSDGARLLDRHVCADGHEVFFDVTFLLPAARS